jgi:hypothetical protein
MFGSFEEYNFDMTGPKDSCGAFLPVINVNIGREHPIWQY